MTWKGEGRIVAKRKSKKRKTRRPRLRRAFLRFVLYWGLVAAVWAVIGAIGIAAYLAYTLPDLRHMNAAARAPSITVLARDGTTLATYGNLYGDYLTLEDMPKTLIQAVVATEDRRFYSHLGLDPRGLLRAALANFRAGRVVQGGSTITQQLAKNAFLTPERTLARKIKELMLALWLEHEFTKEEILTLYLNRVYLGAGTYGVDAAAHKYFASKPQDLTLYQSALLAGLLKAPSRYAPTGNPEGAAKRTRLVLANMVRAGYLSDEEAAGATEAAPSGRRRGARVRMRNVRYFTDWVLERLPDYVGHTNRDLVVETTLDARLQEGAEQSLGGALEEDGKRLAVAQGALISLGYDGAVRAMVGGRSYGASQFNRATQARRQPGSAFKIFVYLAALERGMTPDTVMRDSPVVFGDWQPQNYSGKFVGEVTLREAFARSLNTVAVKVSERAGRRRVISTAHRLGITSDIPPHPSIALGAADVSPIELTAAYTALANGGEGVWPHGIVRVLDGNDQVLYQRTGSGPGWVVAPKVVDQMTEMLQAVITEGSGHSARLDRPSAGKSGTSQDFRDAWFVGFAGGVDEGVVTEKDLVVQ